MTNYNQTSSFNTQLAVEYGVAAALVYDELSFWGSKSINDGWVYKTYEQMQRRLPFLSEYQLRLAYKVLSDQGLIETKLIKANGAPTLHFRILRNLRMDTEKIKESMDTEKTSESLTATTTATKKNKQKSSGMEDSQKLTLLNRLIAVINPLEKATAERMRMLNGRLADYEPADIILAGHALAKSDWHRENKQMSIDNLLAPSKFGRWYQASITPEVAPKKYAV